MTNAWYPHYPGDYGRDTAHLSLAQHGAYRLLLDHYYSTGSPLPRDSGALYRICRAFDQAERDAVDFVVSHFFRVADDGYHNPRADAEILRREEQHARLSNSGRQGARKRWKDGHPNGPAIGQANGPALASPQPQPQPQPQSKPEPKAKKTPAAKPTPPSDPRFGPFLEFAKGSFEGRHNRPPTWDCFGKDGAALAAFLRRAPQVTQDLWQSHILNYFDSTEPFTLKQGGSLSYFISRFDSFADGPLLAGKGPNGKSKLSGDDLTAANLRAAGYQVQ